MSEMEVLGKCPNCGEDVIGGKYGPYCKCGFTAGKAFGHEFTEKEVKKLLEGKEILLNDCKKKGEDGKEPHKYEMYVKADGVDRFDFKKKDGSDAVGYRFKFETRFPEKEPAPVLGKCPNCGKDVKKGAYGAFCSGKCGFTLNKAYGRELTTDELKKIINNEEVLLKNLVHKDDDGNEKTYDMYVKAVDIEEYTYVKKDDTEATGIRYRFETRFPDKGKKEEKTDADTEDVEDEAPEIEIGDEDLPF